MTDDFPFHITPRDFDKLSLASEREQLAYRAYIDAAMQPGPSGSALMELREAWTKECEAVAQRAAMILRLHHLVADVLACGPGNADA